jgi:hypothetical protein
MKLARSTVLAGLTFAALGAFAPGAHAEEVGSRGKGIVGGALLGGEIVVIGMSVAGVKSTGAYLGGAAGGAAAGGVGGYFIENASTDGRVPIYILAGGLALIIPGVVLALNATRHQPTEGAQEDKPVDGPPPNPGKPDGAAVVGGEPPPSATPPAGGGGGAPKAPLRAPATSMIDYGDHELRLRLPVPDVRPVFSPQERKQYGMSQASEVRVPLVHVAF